MKLQGKERKDVVSATSYFAGGLAAATAIYLLAANILGPLVRDDQGRDISDETWLHALLVYGFSSVMFASAAWLSYRVIKRGDWPQPGRVISTALFSAIVATMLGEVLLPQLPVIPFLAVIAYGAVLYWLKTHPKRLKQPIIILTAGVLLLVGTMMATSLKPESNTRAFVDTVWLPDPRQQHDDYSKLLLPTEAMAGQHYLYGPHLLLPSKDNKGYRIVSGHTLYEARASAWLNPAHCPNVANIDELVPGKCEVIGTVRGSKVYAMTRDLALGDTSVYTQFASTFIFFYIPMGSEDEALSYLRTLRKVPAGRVATELAANNRAVSKLAARLQHKHDTVAERLPFGVVLPASLPPGWKQEAIDQSRIGGSLDHPDLVEVSFYDDKGLRVTVYMSKLSDFHWKDASGTCGPIPGELKPVDCYPIIGQDAMYANKPGVQYTFRAVGTTMTVTEVYLDEEDFKTPGTVEAILRTARDISASLQPVDSAKIKHAEFVEGYGD